MGGMWDCARNDTPCWAGGYQSYGCGGGSCHGNVVENSTTQVFINGLPASYVAGQSYDITVWVIGAPIYTFVDNGCRAFGLLPVDGFNNLAGFNIELGAGTKQNPLPTGTLTPSDSATQVMAETQCDQFNRFTGCGYGIPQAVCAAPPACDATKVVGYQATHAPAPGGTQQLSWNLHWTAPAPAVGDVTFYLAGNVVNGNCRPDIGDRWTVGAGTKVPQAAP
jgi:hypothetical protein